MSMSMIRLLFIEDNPADALLVREMLGAAQHIGWNLPRCELKHVVRLQEGVDCLENEPFDVILSDLDLPDSRAEDTVATLREHAPQMPLVVLTGREDETLARKSVRAGVQDYLYKNEVTGSLLARSMVYAIERQETQEALERRVEERTAELRDREEHYQSLFENAPISIWEEDFSAVKEVIDDLRDSGVRDFRTYFSQRPQLVRDLAARVKVLDINRCTVEMYEAEDKHEFRRGLNDIFGETSYDAFIDTLCVIATGKTEFRCEKTDRTVTGKDIETDLRWSVVPGYEETYAKVLVSIADVTEYKRMEEALKRRAEDLKAINELAIHLTTAPSSDDHLELIAEVLKSITNALAVVASVYDPKAQALIVKYLAAKGERIARMNELLGRRVEGFSMPVSAELYAQITQEVERKVPDLHAATLGAMPKPVSTAAQRVFGIDHCISLAFTDRDKLWGSAVIVMSKGQTSPSDEVMEIFARVTAAYLQQRQAEAARRESEERFRLIAESSADVIFQLDLEGRVTYCSPAVERVLGFGPDEVTGIQLTRFFSRSGQAEALHNFEQVIATGCGVTFEAEIIDHTGSPVLIEATLAPIQKDGHVVGVQGHARDVTERKQMEEEIEGERAFLAAVIDNIKEAVIICDEEGRITRFNEAARQLHGLPERPIPPDQWSEYYDLYREDGTTPLSTQEIPLFRALHGERVHDAEIVVNPEHDEPRSLVCNGQAMVDESGQLTGAVVTMRDITERKRMEAALRASEARLSAILRYTPTIIYLKDRQGQFTLINRAFEKTFGTSRAETLGKTAYDLVPAEMAAEYQAHDEQVMRTGKSLQIEESAIEADGQKHTVLSTKFPMYGADGELLGVGGISTDITERKRAEEALRETTQRFQALLDHSPALVHIFDEEGRYLLVGEATAEAMGLAREEIIGKTFADLLPPETVATFMRRVERLKEDRAVLSVKDQIPVNGEERFFESLLFPLSDEAGMSTYAAIATDVTARKRAEEALRESEERLKLALRGGGLGTWDWDTQTDKVQFNERWAEMLGYRLEEIEPHLSTWKNLVHPGDLPRVSEKLNAHLEGRTSSYEAEFRMQHKSSEWVWVLDRGKVIERDEKGRPLRACGTHLDITQRKRSEAALRENEARFRTIVNALPQFVAYTDKNLVYRFVNQTYQEKFDVEPEEMIGKTLPEVIGEDAFEEARPHVEKALRGEQVRYHERYDYAIGGTRDIDGILVPDIAADGEVRGYYAVLTDITPYMEMQEELRQTTERLRIIREIDTAILRAQSSQEIAVATLERLHHLIPCRHTSIAEIDPSQQKGRDMIVLIDGVVQTEPGPWHPLTRAGEQLVADIQQGQTYLVDDIAALETLSALEQALVDHDVRSYVSVPLMVEEAPVGTLNLGSETPDFFQSSHIQILEEIAASLAVALQQARLLEQTQRDAETKALLLREVNHRVKNNLNGIIGLLYVERRHAPPEALPAYDSIMDDLIQRITGLSEVHQMLSGGEWAPLNLGELAERIIQVTVQRASEDLDVRLDVSPASVYVQPAQAQHLALILSELTTNTLKYGVGGREAVHIAVRVTQQEGVITLTYRNDGPGYAEEVLSLERHSAGLDIVKRSVRKNLRGELTLRNEDGAVTEIRFKSEE